MQPTHLTEFYNNLREDGISQDCRPDGLSDKTILHNHRLINSILNCGQMKLRDLLGTKIAGKEIVSPKSDAPVFLNPQPVLSDHNLAFS